MKQYLDKQQTAKLIELGFEKTNIKLEISDLKGMRKATLAIIKGFSIGELIAFLPENVAKQDEIPSTLNISVMHGEWCVQYADFLGADFEFCNTELIDALYDVCVKLKEKGVI